MTASPDRAWSGSPYEPLIGFARAARAAAPGRVVAVAGTAPVWPGGRVDPDPAAQARRCWQVVLAALAELGGRPADVVRTRHYLIDAGDAAAVGAVHAEVFAAVQPASTMVVVAALLDPQWRVEVELDAVLPPG